MAATLKSILPAPKQMVVETYHPAADAPLYPSAKKLAKCTAPPYGKRLGWIPRTDEDFGDGGAYPEIHVPQFPLGMGKKEGLAGGIVGSSQSLVPLATDAAGNVRFDAIAQFGHAPGRVVHSRPVDMMAKSYDDEELQRPDENTIMEITEKTRRALEVKVDSRVKNNLPTHIEGHKTSEAQFFRYTPSSTSAAHAAGAGQRLVRMVSAAVDPMEPPKFKNVKAPRAPPSPPAPVMHSPPKKLTKEERDMWNIPPCISNWKNNKGYTIPLDKRLAADGRGLQETTINAGFAKLAEVLLIAEQNAREEISKRAAVAKQLALQERQRREKELREVAAQARMERAGLAQVAAKETEEERRARLERERLREERRLEREREHRLEAMGRKVRSAEERDISEKIALGIPVQRSQESLFDQRLFNQTGGLDSGFGDDESYNVYDKPLFGSEREHALYRAPTRDAYEDEKVDLDKLARTDRFRPDRDFQGVDRSSRQEPRKGPVEFEKDTAEADPFGINDFLSEAKSSSRKRDRESSPQTSSARLGVMHAVAGSGSGGDFDRQSKRAKLDFEPERRKRD